MKKLCLPLKNFLLLTIMASFILIFIIYNYNKSNNVFSTSAPTNESYHFVKQWGSADPLDGRVTNIQGIVIDSDGNIYLSDSRGANIQKFDSNGNFLKQWGSAGSAPGQFNGPQGLAVDKLGNVYVIDSGNKRIQVFALH